MNYLVTHYKNLAEQLQSRINHIQQCLYEMDKATIAPPGGLNTPEQTTPSIDLPRMGGRESTEDMLNRSRDMFRTNTPGNVAPWKIIPTPANGTKYYYYGREYTLQNGVWFVDGPNGPVPYYF